MMPNKSWTLVALSVTVLALSGCSYRTVDPVLSGAQPVPGTGVLHRFCDESTLIYVSIAPNEPDNFEAFFAGWCAQDSATGQWLPAIGAPPATSVPTAPGQDDTNQQDERDGN